MIHPHERNALPTKFLSDGLVPCRWEREAQQPQDRRYPFLRGRCADASGG